MFKSKYVIVVLLLVIIFSFVSLYAQDIVPKPKYYVANGQTFDLSPDVKILYASDLKELPIILEK